MATEKIAITLEKDLLEEIDRGVRNGLFKNRSRAIKEAVREKIERQRQTCLVAEVMNLDPKEEQALAEEGMTGEGNEWMARPQFRFHFQDPTSN